jgi:hypothetical protein
VLAETTRVTTTADLANAAVFGIIVFVVLAAIAIWVAIVFWRESR